MRLAAALLAALLPGCAVAQNLPSPAFKSPTALTQPAGDNSNRLATTGYVDRAAAAATPGNGSVSNAKLAPAPTNTIKCNPTSALSSPQDCSAAQVNAILGTSGGGGSGTIADGSVTNAKLASAPAGTVKCNTSGSAAAPQDCTPSQVGALIGPSSGLAYYGFNQVQQASDLAYRNNFIHFYDQGADRILTAGDGGYPNGNNANFGGNIWMEIQYANTFFHRCIGKGDAVACARVRGTWNYVSSTLGHGGSGHGLQSVDRYPNGNMGYSDDAAWIINYLVQVYEVTGDNQALTDVLALFPKVLNSYRDPNQTQITLPNSSGELKPSPYGICYIDCTTTNDKKSSIYEAMMAAAAVKIYQWTQHGDYLEYAKFYYNMANTYYRNGSIGRNSGAPDIYMTELGIDPSTSGTGCDRGFLHTVQFCYGPPRRGNTAEYDGGSLAMATLAARLGRVTGQQAYFDQAKAIINSMVSTTGFLRQNKTVGGVTGDMFLNPRDQWTGAYWHPYAVEEVLTIPGADPNLIFANALHNTALSIAGQITSDGYFGADWSGPESTNADGTGPTDYITQAGGPNSNNQATPHQMMTSANGESIIVAAAIMDSQQYRPVVGKVAFPAGGAQQVINQTISTVSVTTTGIKYITSSGTYTPSSGTTAINVECIGGGAGGGGAIATGGNGGSVGGGGGAGQLFEKFLSPAPSSTSVTIGSGGNGSGGSDYGGDGGDTYFGSYVAHGGKGGTSSSNYTAVPQALLGGIGGLGATGGDRQGGGEPGQSGVVLAFNLAWGGSGGNTKWGNGGAGRATQGSTPGAGAGGFGTGGGGAANTQNQGAQSGASGKPGMCRIEEYH